MMIQRSLRPLLSRGILRRIPLAAADSCLRRGFSSSSESTSSIPDPATHVEKEVNRQGSQTATTVSVDRSGLYNPPQHSHEPSSDSELVKHLQSIIKFRGGPISVAEYMSEVLTNPKSGFYINRDVFGAGGDFITSPEVSQMFGEMVGVWAMCLWEQMGQPEKVNLVELGPGRGTLMADLLRGTSKFEAFTKSLSIHLVECSPTLRKSQFDTLKCVLNEGDATGTTNENSMSSLVNAPVTWHNAFDQVPSGLPTIVIAHEFYDALPVHQFQRAPLGWCEKMIDIEKDSTFRFVLSPQPTPAKLHLMRRLKWAAAKEFAPLDHIEVCPQAMELTEEISKRLGVDGGGALIIDYGQNEIVSDSLQAIRQHKFVGVLDNPGSADLSAYVDFAMVRRSAEEASDNVSVHGPISQSQFLGSLGINFRAEALLQKCTEKQAEALQAGYWRLVGDGKAPFWDGPPELAPIGMGTRYLALAIVNKNQGSPVPFQ